MHSILIGELRDSTTFQKLTTLPHRRFLYFKSVVQVDWIPSRDLRIQSTCNTLAECKNLRCGRVVSFWKVAQARNSPINSISIRRIDSVELADELQNYGGNSISWMQSMLISQDTTMFANLHHIKYLIVYHEIWDRITHIVSMCMYSKSNRIR